MFLNKTRRSGRLSSKLPTALNALGGILIGIVVAYLAIFFVSILDGDHVFNPEAVRGLAVIGLVVLGYSWYESELKHERMRE